MRQHDAALQFLGAWVGTLGEVDDGTFLPPAVPSLDDRFQLLVEDKGGGGGGERKGRILGFEGENVGCRGQREVVAVALGDGGVALPLQAEVVAGGVQLMLDDDGVGVSGKTANHS